MIKYTTLCLLAILLSSCNTQRAKNDVPMLTVTMEPQRYFTEAIAGDKFNVTSMVPKGSNPETYDPTPSQLVALSDSKAYLRIGYIGFEQSWMERLLNNTPHLQVFDTSKGIDLIFDDSHNHGDCQHGESGVEPHIWSSTNNALIIARNTYKALSTLDSQNEPYYLTRYDSLCHQIQQTDSVIRQLLSTPGTARAFMIYHPALSYFARDYGLHQISIEEGGKEPSPTHLKELIDLCKNEGVRVIFVQPEFDRRNAEIIAEQTGTRVVPINPLSYNWSEELINAAKALIP
ncbi:zinc ABC transporter substrate-binding protein [Bacteroides sp.]|uniref:metal ABC transporter solute-binding protein, Zn/Mn family n=1 Tax=Bacteroides sp. TaxID=29523 RepID=UPI001B781D33|nr:zinc ABC transporter substrate-binding protein [Bacteroides sp.]MBP6064997.1 zinc ABC transporter substrate-binding protein [Bacteroides sp.]MBP6067315.1 zinc ABC transporter substrate-binding protein [Bacteroides sp.]MBP6935556.1 zinc ABC transporter substrate-binding protein [Bacteroides sp.]MBP8621666.1 zinc ABC transporter substrate-binding protein [Bacteroides sp.]MBP9586019.1 zinc ABC transporter substrate-binding protein [Bacteroides sp.]